MKTFPREMPTGEILGAKGPEERQSRRGGSNPKTRENWDFSVLLKERRENGTQKLREFL